MKTKVVIFYRDKVQDRRIYINADVEIQWLNDDNWKTEDYQKAMKETLKYQRII